MLADLMENELIAPEDAGYYPIDDEDECDGECCCGDCRACCAEDEDDEEFSELMAAFTSLAHSIFGALNKFALLPTIVLNFLDGVSYSV